MSHVPRIMLARAPGSIIMATATLGYFLSVVTRPRSLVKSIICEIKW